MQEPQAPKPGARTLATDALAGALTAAVFYAEYTGLGAVLGAALPGRASAALGGLMVIGAVVVSSLLALAVRQPFIAGPRAASLAVLIFGMKFAVEHASAQEGRFVVAMAAMDTMLVVAAATLLLGLVPAMQRFIDGSHVALRKGFVFATAVGIVVGLSAIRRLPARQPPADHRHRGNQCWGSTRVGAHLPSCKAQSALASQACTAVDAAGRGHCHARLLRPHQRIGT